jgi:hypothetical protein
MKHIKNFELFEKVNLNWKQEDLQKCIDRLSHYLEHAEELTGEDDLAPEDAILLLDEIGTDETLELSKTIDGILDLIAQFDVESAEEKSRLN